MPRVGSRHETAPDLAQQRLLTHDAQYPLVVDGPPLAAHHVGHPPVPIAGAVEQHLLDPPPPGPRCRVLRRLSLRLLVPPAAADAQQRAHPPRRQLREGCLDRVHQRVPLREARLLSPFFSAAFSSASCPQKRSNSAIRRCKASVPSASDGVNAASPRSAYSCRQRESTLLAS